jgi:uncharacterized protein YkwD
MTLPTAPARANTTGGRPSRPRNLVRALALTLGLLTLGGGLAACDTPQQQEVGTLINRSRSNYGRRTLSSNFQLSTKAQSWANTLASRCSLSHSNLASGINYNWRALGENVGYGRSIADVHSAYMNSPGHTANILDRRWNYMGTGVAYGCGKVFTVQEFMQY